MDRPERTRTAPQAAESRLARRTPETVVATLIGVLGVSACSVAGPREESGRSRAAADTAVPAGEARLVLEHVAAETASWSPDGSSLLVDDQEFFGLRIVKAAGGPASTFTEDPYHAFAEWSPVADVIAYVDKSLGGLFTLPVDAEDAEPVQLVPGPVEGYAAPWSPDGSMLLFQREGRLEVVEVASGRVRTLAAPGADGNPVVGARWSTDGTAVVAQRRREIIVVDLGDDSVRVLDGISGRAPAFGPGEAIWFIGGDSDRPLMHNVDGGISRVEGIGGAVVSFDVHRSSGRLAVAVRGRGIVVRDAAGGSERVITDEPADSSPRWSPDGKSLAFVRPGSGGLTLCVIEPQGKLP